MVKGCGGWIGENAGEGGATGERGLSGLGITGGGTEAGLGCIAGVGITGVGGGLFGIEVPVPMMPSYISFNLGSS